MKRLLVTLAALVGLATPADATEARPAGRDSLVYVDDFDTLSPDWSHRANSCAACVRVRDGKMILSLRPDPALPGHYLTGHVGTEDAFEPTFGYFEVRAKFASPRGAHSAAWLQTTEDYIPGQAEIDFAEHFGRSAVWHNVYWREPGMGAEEFLGVKKATRLSAAKWHTYGVDWLPDRYVFYVDGERVATIRQGLSARPKFLVLSMKRSPWEVEHFDPARLGEYRAKFAWIRVWE